MTVTAKFVSKSTLILLFVHFIHQWIKFIDQIVFNQFIIYLYYNDYRQQTEFIDLKQIVKFILISKHHIFDRKKKEIVRILIISSYSTFFDRYDSRKLKIWKINSKKWKMIDAINEFHILNKKWFQCLSRKFFNIVLNEAHIIKNWISNVVTTVYWLNANFYLMTTIISMLNEIMNFKNYMRLIQFSNVDQLWFNESFINMKLKKNVNLYHFSNDHFESILRLIQKTTHDFIFRITIDSVIQNQRIVMIWQKCLIKRIHVFRISFNDAKIIEANLSKVKCTAMKCEFLFDEQKKYQNLKSLFLNKIITQNTETKKSKWFFDIHRKLCMYISWVKFAKLKIKINVKTISIKHWISQFDFFKIWLRLIYEKENIIMKIKVEKLFALVCQDAFKLKVLLMTFKI